MIGCTVTRYIARAKINGKRYAVGEIIREPILEKSACLEALYSALRRAMVKEGVLEAKYLKITKQVGIYTENGFQHLLPDEIVHTDDTLEFST
jgi:hypothetical protein